MVIVYKKWKKYNEIELTKKMDLKNRKITNCPPSPDERTISWILLLNLIQTVIWQMTASQHHLSENGLLNQG